MQGQTEYLYEGAIEFQNFKANIFRPVLTEAEKSKRMQKIYKASAEILEGVKNEEVIKVNYT